MGNHKYLAWISVPGKVLKGWLLPLPFIEQQVKRGNGCRGYLVKNRLENTTQRNTPGRSLASRVFLDRLDILFNANCSDGTEPPAHNGIIQFHSCFPL